MNDKLDGLHITIVKLGGSLITNKDKPLSVNTRAVAHVARSLKKTMLPSASRKLILIHGGGSFGHYFAKRFGITTSPSHITPSSVSKTTGAMLQLHSELRYFLDEQDVSVESILPSELLSKDGCRLTSSGLNRLKTSFANGLIPVSFGFVNLSNSGASIVSGDKICEAIARSIHIDRVIFAMDVDGIYRNKDLEGDIIEEMGSDKEFASVDRKFDVTGGISAKAALGFRLARLGSQVFFVNGEKKDRLLKLMIGRSDVRATRVRGN